MKITASKYHNIRRLIRRILLSYSRVISITKLWLLSIAALFLGVLFIYPQIMEHKKLFDLTVSSDIFSDAQSIRMTNMRYSVVDKDNKPIHVTSELAEERVVGSGNIELTKPKADMVSKDGEAINISSERGIFNQNEQKLRLFDNIEIFSSKGYEVFTSELEFDMQKKTIIGDNEVQARGDFGHITAEGVVIRNNGDKIYFTGHTSLQLFEKDKK